MTNEQEAINIIESRKEDLLKFLDESKSKKRLIEIIYHDYFILKKLLEIIKN